MDDFPSEPEEILAMSCLRGCIIFLVKFKGLDKKKAEIVPLYQLREKYPQLVIQYFQSRIKLLDIDANGEAVLRQPKLQQLEPKGNKKDDKKDDKKENKPEKEEVKEEKKPDKKSKDEPVKELKAMDPNHSLIALGFDLCSDDDSD